MAIMRLLFRKRNTLFICLCASTFWLIYLFLSLPSNKDKRPVLTSNSVRVSLSDNTLQKSVPSRHYFVTSPKNTRVKVIPQENVIVAPKKIGDENKVSKNNTLHNENVLSSNNKTVKNDTQLPPDKAKPLENEGNFKKVMDLGEKLKNKTFEVGEKVKNKTLEKLSELGVLKVPKYSKVLYALASWPLNLSLSDVSEVMKETKYLNKQEPIAMNYPKLYPVKSNVTVGNKTVALRKVVMANRVGFCDCLEYDCMCCAHVSHRSIHVNATACANITFMTKSQEFDFRFSLDKKPLYKNQISVEHPPKVCLGSITKVADLCTGFLNVTTRVNVHEEHKLHVEGCVEFSINLFNRTVSTFPVDCFQIPSHQHHHEEHHKVIQDIGNWMP